MNNNEEKKDWREEAVEFHATPESLREFPTIREFCLHYKIPERTYYYHISKPDISKRVIEISLRFAKNSASKVLQKLSAKAEKGDDNKAMEMYLEYIIKLAKQLDLKSDGKALNLPDKELKNEIVKEMTEILK